MKAALISRSTLFTVPGGDTVQITQTARYLAAMGVIADIKRADEPINYQDYDLLHLFNITRPADLLYHSRLAGKPFVVSTILCNYSEYDRYHRKGIGTIFSYLPADHIEYLKTVARFLLGKDKLVSPAYAWMGQRRCMQEIMSRAAMLLPNSESEYSRLVSDYGCKTDYLVVPNGVDPEIFHANSCIEKDDNLVLCVARIEGIKNQLNLIKALNNTRFKLLLIGSHSPNQAAYYQECHSIAASNIRFIGHIPQDALVSYYQQAKVHILPSWFETTGLSSVEAAVMGCNIVITNRGDAREYFENDAFYCDPASPTSMLHAVEKAASAPFNQSLQHKILGLYTWKQAAAQTLKAYQQAIA